MLNATLFMDNGQLVRLDENNLSRLVAARLKWPVSQTLIDRSYNSSIIERCWKDQLSLKGRLKSRTDIILTIHLYI